MDEMALAVVGAAAVVTVLGRRARPVAKLAMRGVVTATEATSAGRRGVQDLYAEVKTERQQRLTQKAQQPPAEAETATSVTE